MAKFVLRNNFFKIVSKVKLQISGSAIGTIFAPSYAYIFINKVEYYFLEMRTVKPLVQLRYIDIFLNKIWILQVKNLKSLLISWTWKIEQHLETDLYCKPTIVINSLILTLRILSTQKNQLRIIKVCALKDCSSNVAFEIHLESLQGWFKNSGYPKTLFDNQLKRVTEKRKTSDQTCQWGNGVTLLLIYQVQLKNVYVVIKKHLVFLYAKE